MRSRIHNVSRERHLLTLVPTSDTPPTIIVDGVNRVVIEIEQASEGE